jgi:hypothetical protein
MVPHITAILQRLTGEWATLLQPEAILAACGEVGSTGWRDRLLTPVTTVPLFLLQMLPGHTACRHLPPLGRTVQRGGLLPSPRQTPAASL